MFRTISLVIVLATAAFGQESAKDEAQVWNLEKAYWEYVKGNDLEKYRALWHEDFVGWPFVNASPVRKDHITDWITANTSKGVRLQSYSIEELAIRVTGDIAIDPTESNSCGQARDPAIARHKRHASHIPGPALMARGKFSVACPRR